jgi:Sulfotransferase family.
MTILSKDGHTILFLHIPKCGGSSVVETFRAAGYETELEIRGKPIRSFMRTTPQHLTCSDLRSMVRFDQIEKVFAVVRHPVDRLLSEYRWTHRETEPTNLPDVNDWLQETLAIVADDITHQDNHFRPMVTFFDPSIAVEIFPIEHSLNAICSYFLNNSDQPLVSKAKHLKDSRTFPNSDKLANAKLSPESLALICRFYAQDFLAFGYPIRARGRKSKPREQALALLEANKASTLGLLVHLSARLEGLEDTENYTEDQILLLTQAEALALRCKLKTLLPSWSPVELSADISGIAGALNNLT